MISLRNVRSQDTSGNYVNTFVLGLMTFSECCLSSETVVSKAGFGTVWCICIASYLSNTGL